VAISTIPRLLSGPLAGWVGLYQLSVGMALLFIPFLIVIKKQTEVKESIPAKASVVEEALQS
jgi:PAT family beta-lactamase induction signal transducer AmpG